MTDLVDPYNPSLKAGDQLHGYRVENIVPLKEIHAVCYRLTHMATHARHIHISTRDPENTFAVTFKTVPTDSTGVAHILEHTVLCGSQRYPVRDPFFSMIKRSLSTFMNAFTASDWTMYPFSSQNTKDFYNLMDVYLDAAFFPRLEALSFKQEGHRVETVAVADPPDHPGLVFKGVVYNEMKGAMSSPDQVMGRSLLNALYPDTTYRNNSGGDPAEIPNLTHAQLVAFHQRHYHPSNAFFYTYGNLPLDRHLAFVAEKVMGRFEAIDPGTDVPNQPRWPESRRARYTYPLAESEDPARKSQVALAWLTCDIQDTFEVLVLRVLEQILLGNAASPLRKDLMDSGLGSALSDGSGYDADARDTLFACGLKDMAETDADQVEKIILACLGRLAREGLEKELIETAIHQIEFHRKEITNTPYPYGIKLILNLIGTWMHGGEPERALRLDADLDRLRRELADGPFLEQRIRRYFLDNPHRVRLTLAPDARKAQMEEAQTLERLRAMRAQLSDADIERLNREAEQLKQLQDRPEDVDCLPTLALTDIPPEIQRYAHDHVMTRLPLWSYHQPTSGIFYFIGAAGAADVPEALLPWVPFFCFAFPKIGTQRCDYAQMARRIDAATGGLGLSAQARVLSARPGTCLPLVALNAKCLNRNIAPMADIVEELIGETRFSDHERLKQLIGEYRAGLEAGVVQNGHRLAISLSSRAFGPACALSETWNGVHQVRLIRAFCDRLDGAGIEALAADLAAIARAAFAGGRVALSAIGESEIMAAAEDNLARSPLFTAFNAQRRDLDFKLLDVNTEAALPFEGWRTSSAVAFVARTARTVCLGHADAPCLAVLSKLLRSMYLHREIREKGGAYGGFALYNPESGLFSQASYRDPHIAQTLKVYDGAIRFIRSGEFTQDDVKEAILQMCSEIDKPDPPGPAARKAFFRLIVGMTDEMRLAFKQDLLKVTRERLIEAAERHLAAAPSGVAVIAGAEQLEKANTQFADKPLALHTI